MEPKNITTVMPQLFAWLKGNPDKESLAYTTIMKHSQSEEEGLSQALRLLIHYYGDVHQPLHNSNRYTQDRPSGDRGGNDFILKYHYTANELHAVWDTVVYENHKSIKRPFTEETFAEFGTMTDNFMDGVIVPKGVYETTDFGKFRDESFAIAKHVYDGLTEGTDQVVPADYIAKWVPVAKERAATAAYRLAYAIEQIYGTSTENDSFLV